MIKTWNIRFKDGKPVINIISDGVRPMKTLTPKSEEVKITPEGLIVGDIVCDFSKIHYNTVPTPLSKLEVDLTQSHILYLVYEIISGYLYNKCPVVVNKISYDIKQIVSKYPEFNIAPEVFNYFRE